MPPDPGLYTEECRRRTIPLIAHFDQWTGRPRLALYVLQYELLSARYTKVTANEEAAQEPFARSSMNRKDDVHAHIQ